MQTFLFREGDKAERLGVFESLQGENPHIFFQQVSSVVSFGARRSQMVRTICPNLYHAEATCVYFYLHIHNMLFIFQADC